MNSSQSGQYNFLNVIPTVCRGLELPLYSTTTPRWNLIINEVQRPLFLFSHFFLPFHPPFSNDNDVDEPSLRLAFEALVSWFLIFFYYFFCQFFFLRSSRNSARLSFSRVARTSGRQATKSGRVPGHVIPRGGALGLLSAVYRWFA